MKDLEPRDRDLLNALQADLPISSTPFAVVGQQIDMSEKEVLKRAERMRREGALKQLAASFDARALGYRSCLVAARVSEEEVDRAASVVNLHPGVTQNYKRNHEFNLWFTLALPPDSSLGVEGTLKRLGETAGWDRALPLPTLRTFKSGDGGEIENVPNAEPLGEEELAVLRLLQRDLPLQPRPFDALSRVSGIPAERILEITRRFQAQHQLRRIAAVVQTRKQSFLATAMGVWSVADADVDRVAVALRNHRAVSQCFLRPTYPEWPYNIFTTVQGRSVDECESSLSELEDETGVHDRRVLFPLKEYKRARLNLFSSDILLWETGSEPRAAAS